jgi:crossover junction endodeoxyribonuclease RusA
MKLDHLTITLPWPDTSLMPNRKNGKHWGSTQAAKVRARQAGQYGALSALAGSKLTMQARMPVKITFVAPDKRSRDLDGLLSCIKPQIDGIAQALGIDDKAFRPITLDDAVDTKKQGFLIVEIGI